MGPRAEGKEYVFSEASEAATLRCGHFEVRNDRTEKWEIEVNASEEESDVKDSTSV